MTQSEQKVVAKKWHFCGREKISFGRKGIDFPANVVIIVATMEFEWNEKKNLENIRKQGWISFLSESYQRRTGQRLRP
jgi:hypothetical protein